MGGATNLSVLPPSKSGARRWGKLTTLDADLLRDPLPPLAQLVPDDPLELLPPHLARSGQVVHLLPLAGGRRVCLGEGGAGANAGCVGAVDGPDEAFGDEQGEVGHEAREAEAVHTSREGVKRKFSSGGKEEGGREGEGERTRENTSRGGRSDDLSWLRGRCHSGSFRNGRRRRRTGGCVRAGGTRGAGSLLTRERSRVVLWAKGQISERGSR